MSDLEKGIKKMPSDWWRLPPVAKELSHLFVKHLIGLHIAVKDNNHITNHMLTGVAMIYNNRLWWLTAGHIAKLINETRQNAGCKIVASAFIDVAIDDGPAKNRIPIDINHLEFIWEDEGPIDFGIAEIRAAYLRPLLQSNTIEPITEQLWFNHMTASPEGYYIVGFPSNWMEPRKTTISGTSQNHLFSFGTACLPIEKIVDRGSEANGINQDFWGHPTAFYGRLLIGTQDGAPNDIDGMSGGPVISIERTSDGQLRYRLFGFQSQWLPQSQIIRATSIADIEYIFKPS